MRRSRHTGTNPFLAPSLILLFLAAMLFRVGPAVAATIVPDQYTVLLDHFDQGTAQSLPGLGNSIDLGAGQYVKYAVSWDMARSTQGTVEMWINPSSSDVGLVDLNWLDSPTYPMWGHILHFQVNGGLLTMGNWGGGGTAPKGNTLIPVDEWTHVALTWGADGTRLYVNGILDATSPDNLYPAVMPTDYLYLNYWGSGALGLVDELHVSDIQRSAQEIQAHAQVVPEPGTLALVGSGFAGLLGWCRRRREK